MYVHSCSTQTRLWRRQSNDATTSLSLTLPQSFNAPKPRHATRHARPKFHLARGSDSAAFDPKPPTLSKHPNKSQTHKNNDIPSLSSSFLSSLSLSLSNRAGHPPTMAQSTAHRRLLQEYRALTNNPPEGITAGPVSEDDLLHWECLIQGPEGTPFEGGVFPAELKFPKDYPLAPPTMKFLADMWHPNGMNPSKAYIYSHKRPFTR